MILEDCGARMVVSMAGILEGAGLSPEEDFEACVVLDPIGDVDEESPDILGMAADGGALPPAMDPVRRQLWLARLLAGFRIGDSALVPAQTVRLAESLARLMDSLCNADATPEQLVELLPDRFSRHWQDILKLLTILIDRWSSDL